MEAYVISPWNIPAKAPAYPAKRFVCARLRGTYRTFWPPTPSRGRPPPHRKIVRPKGLTLCSFCLPDLPRGSLSLQQSQSQENEKGGLSLRGVAVTTETATTAETAKTVKVISWQCILQDKGGQGASEPSKPPKPIKINSALPPCPKNPKYPPPSKTRYLWAWRFC